MSKNVCRSCGKELTKDNWFPSLRKGKSYICKSCRRIYKRLWSRKTYERRKSHLAKSQKIYYRKHKESRYRRHNAWLTRTTRNGPGRNLKRNELLGDSDYRSHHHLLEGETK